MRNYYTANIYLDDRKNILIIPYAKNEHGIRMSVNHPQKLVWQNDNFSELGEKTLEVLNVSTTHPPIKKAEAVRVYAEATGIKSWVQFAKKHQLVSIARDEDIKIYEFEFRQRQKDNSFGNDKGDIVPIRKLPLTVTTEEIGRAVIEVFTEAGVLE